MLFPAFSRYAILDYVSRPLAAIATVTVLAAGVTACSDGQRAESGSSTQQESAQSGANSQKEVEPLRNDYATMKTVTTNSENSASTVLDDVKRTGVETSHTFFESSKDVVIAGNDPEALNEAARMAVERGIPMLTWLGDGRDVAQEVKRLKVDTVIKFGDSPRVEDLVRAGVPQDLEFVEGDYESLEEAGSRNASVAKLSPPVQGEKPVDVFVTKRTSLAAVATARAAGANVDVLPAPDPRATSKSMAAAKEGVIAIGQAFRGQDYFSQAARMIDAGELPGGGGLLFPGRRMIALYGHPSGGALGVMGEQPPKEAVARVNKLVEEYQPHSDYQVMPAFEIIATVASDSPGPDGDYSNEADPAELEPYIDAITEAGGYAFLDLQPGQASLLEQAKRYEKLLKKPNVGLALDPEWKLHPGQKPMENVGYVEVDEINQVSHWLANLVRRNNLPQKGLIMHQFQLQMIRNRESLNTNYPELAHILHADGHGPPGEKFATWEAMKKDLPAGVFLAWKNFYDEDSPTFSPEKSYKDVKPRPWFISYQ